MNLNTISLGPWYTRPTNWRHGQGLGERWIWGGTFKTQQQQQQWQATLLHPFMSMFHHFAGMMEAKKAPLFSFFLSLLQGQLNEFQLKFPFFLFPYKSPIDWLISKRLVGGQQANDSYIQECKHNKFCNKWWRRRRRRSILVQNAIMRFII